VNFLRLFLQHTEGCDWSRIPVLSSVTAISGGDIRAHSDVRNSNVSVREVITMYGDVESQRIMKLAIKYD
jgi:hypothetical protein